MKFLRAVFGKLRIVLELFVLAPLYEVSLRARSFLDPRTQVSAQRLKAIMDGELAHNGGEIAIFAASFVGRYPPFFMHLFEALKRASIDLVIISNRELATEVVEQLRPKCRWLIIRENVGRDFGAYADAIRFLSSKNINPERLFLFNDSLYYREEGIVTELINPMRQHEFSAATVYQRPLAHAQSFSISFSKEILEHPVFRDYWRQYRPIDTRRWAISRGELGLSVALGRAGFTPVAIFSTETVTRCLLDHVRMGEVPVLKLLPRLTAKRKADVIGDDIGEFQIFKLVDDLAFELAEHSPIHYSGILLWRFANMPIMKRDLVYRGVFSPARIISFFDDEPEMVSDLFKKDMFSRGEGRLQSGWAGFRFRNGFS